MEQQHESDYAEEKAEKKRQTNENGRIQKKKK